MFDRRRFIVVAALLLGLLTVLLLGAGLAVAQVTGPGEPHPAGDVCDRTPAIRDAIRAALNHQACATITGAQLATITSLGHRRLAEELTALKAGDFAGLTGLTRLTLTGRYIFDDEENDFVTTGRLATVPA
ncbi:MAG: hypothetical protein OXI83_16785, partial [Gemmatimonadota bacterium]|nr:hypothetical protein [Gemmatimonadota bacterium]